MRINIDGDDYDPSFFKKIAERIPNYEFTDLSFNVLKFSRSEFLPFDMDIDLKNKKLTLILSTATIPTPEDFKKVVYFINCVVNTLSQIYPLVNSILEVHEEQMSNFLQKFDKRIVDKLDTSGIQSFLDDCLLALSKRIAVQRLDDASQEHLKPYILKGVDLDAISKIKCSQALLVNENWRYRSYDEPIPNQILKAGGKYGTAILQMQEGWISAIPRPTTKKIVDAATLTTKAVRKMFFGCY